MSGSGSFPAFAGRVNHAVTRAAQAERVRPRSHRRRLRRRPRPQTRVARLRAVAHGAAARAYEDETRTIPVRVTGADHHGSGCRKQVAELRHAPPTALHPFGRKLTAGASVAATSAIASPGSVLAAGRGAPVAGRPAPLLEPVPARQLVLPAVAPHVPGVLRANRAGGHHRAGRAGGLGAAVLELQRHCESPRADCRGHSRCRRCRTAIPIRCGSTSACAATTTPSTPRRTR